MKPRGALEAERRLARETERRRGRDGGGEGIFFSDHLEFRTGTVLPLPTSGSNQMPSSPRSSRSGRLPQQRHARLLLLQSTSLFSSWRMC
ncbi:unnamed protein product [Urochloa humidicola]